MISQATIEEVKARASLLDIVGETVQLKRQGSGYTGLCPFHSERSPSFHIRDNEQFFHCFGCGKSGNVFSYLMESQGLSFPEAVEALAQRYGIEVKREGRAKKKDEGHAKKNDLFELNALTAQFYRNELLKKEPALVTYVRERKLTKGAVDAFGVGYAPLGNALTAFLRQKKVPEDIAIASGLLRRNQRGELYDSLRGRLVFPIWIDNRKIAGFGGRMIPALHERDAITVPKYINSPESPVYQKSKILFGLTQAFTAIKEQGEVFVVEGYLDVIGLWQVGVRNVVATCGTALTDEHVKRLSRLTKRIIVMFDADSAGKTAAGKSFLTFANAPVDVWALFAADGEDPDSIAKMYGDKTTQYLSELERRPLVDCYIEMLLRSYDVSDVSALGSAALGSLCGEVAAALALTKDVIARDSLIKRASMKLKVPREKLAEVADHAQSGKKIQIKVEQPHVEDEQSLVQIDIKDLPKLDQEMLHVVMAKKEEYVSRVLNESVLCQLLHPTTFRFVQELDSVLHGESAASSEERKKELVKDILKSFGSSWTTHWKQAHDMGKDREINFEKLFQECAALAKRILNEKILKEFAKEAANTDDESEKTNHFNELLKRRRTTATRIQDE